MGWWTYIYSDAGQTKPKVSLSLLQRVLSYARPYRLQLTLTLILILAATLVTALNPFLFGRIIDQALANGDVTQLNRLAFGLILSADTGV